MGLAIPPPPPSARGEARGERPHLAFAFCASIEASIASREAIRRRLVPKVPKVRVSTSPSRMLAGPKARRHASIRREAGRGYLQIRIMSVAPLKVRSVWADLGRPSMVILPAEVYRLAEAIEYRIAMVDPLIDRIDLLAAALGIASGGICRLYGTGDLARGDSLDCAAAGEEGGDVRGEVRLSHVSSSVECEVSIGRPRSPVKH